MKINKKGFTLIELLVVIAIIGLLSTLAVVSLNSARLKARDARRMSDLKQISTAMELYYSNSTSEAYPTNAVASVSACGDPGIVADEDDAAAIDTVLCGSDPIRDINATYLAAIPDDPTNDSPLVYHYEGTASNYCISAQLEGETSYFVCINGSCYKRPTDCTEVGE